MWRWLGNRGDATPWHVHEREDEEIIVIDGVARFFVGDGAHDARAGAIIFLPRGVPHAYGIVSERAEVIGVAAPGGFEGFSPSSAARSPPAATCRTPSPAAMTSALPARGVTLLGPPRHRLNRRRPPCRPEVPCGPVASGVPAPVLEVRRRASRD